MMYVVPAFVCGAFVATMVLTVVFGIIMTVMQQQKERE